jgi:hypothetical protein
MVTTRNIYFNTRIVCILPTEFSNEFRFIFKVKRDYFLKLH